MTRDSVFSQFWERLSKIPSPLVSSVPVATGLHQGLLTRRSGVPLHHSAVDRSFF